MEHLEPLRAIARASLDANYSPHTGKQVVASLVADLGPQGLLFFGGSNVEGRGGTTVHAEKAAVLAAIQAGCGPYGKWIKALYIDGAFPCGGCRQFLNEFALPDTPVYLEHVGDITLGTLFPFGY